jgi:hypothetical protein
MASGTIRNQVHVLLIVLVAVFIAEFQNSVQRHPALLYYIFLIVVTVKIVIF